MFDLTNKFTVSANTQNGVKVINTIVGEPGFIPGSLAELTNLVIAIHRANGDLGYLADCITDAEGDFQMNDYDINKYLK